MCGGVDLTKILTASAKHDPIMETGAKLPLEVQGQKSRLRATKSFSAVTCPMEGTKCVHYQYFVTRYTVNEASHGKTRVRYILDIHN